MTTLRKIAEIEADKLARLESHEGYIAELLGVAHVPSISPGMGMKLVEQLEAVRGLLTKPELPPDARELLVCYEAAVRLIAVVGGHHQRIVMDALHRYLRSAEAEDLGLQHPDHLETAKALLKLANLGKESS